MSNQAQKSSYLEQFQMKRYSQLKKFKTEKNEYNFVEVPLKRRFTHAKNGNTEVETFECV